MHLIPYRLRPKREKTIYNVKIVLFNSSYEYNNLTKKVHETADKYQKYNISSNIPAP